MTRSVFTSKYKTFCQLLSKSRKEAGFTQAKLAKRLKKHQSFASKIEQGERRIDLVEFLEIAKILKLDVHKFIDDLEKITKEKYSNKKKEPTNLQNQTPEKT